LDTKMTTMLGENMPNSFNLIGGKAIQVASYLAYYCTVVHTHIHTYIHTPSRQIFSTKGTIGTYTRGVSSSSYPGPEIYNRDCAEEDGLGGEAGALELCRASSFRKSSLREAAEACDC